MILCDLMIDCKSVRNRKNINIYTKEENIPVIKWSYSGILAEKFVNYLQLWK